MPRVINPTDMPLFCAAAHETVPANGSIQVTQEVADEVPRIVFRVEADDASQAESEASPAVPAAGPTPAEELAEAEKLLAAAEQMTKGQEQA